MRVPLYILIMRVFTGSKVLLPGSDQPQPATIVVDPATGKITDVRRYYSPTRSDFPDVQETDWIDAAANVILPGIVELVSIVPASCVRSQC